MIAASAALNDDPACGRWLAGSADVRGWREAVTARLAGVAEAEQAAATTRLRDEVVTAWLTPERRHALAERLDVLSWLIASAGRTPAAVLAVATARALRDPAQSALSVPAVARAVELAYEAGRARA